MSEKTNIAWTDSTHNFWRGCTKISPGCQNCYAETLVTNRLQGEWGKGKPRIRIKDFDAPLAWNKKPWICDECGAARTNAYDDCEQCSLPDPHMGFRSPTCHRRRVFSLSLGDIGDPEAPLEWFNEAMVIVDKCRDLTFQLLTKRPVDFLARWKQVAVHWGRTDFNLPTNVWMGTSVENQATADSRIPELLKIPARVRFLSVEPLLEGVDFPDVAALDWVIAGGESGPGARPCYQEWIREIVYQCKTTETACFVKQLGANSMTYQTREKDWKPFKEKKGGDMAEWPNDLRVRQFPKESR